MKIQPITHPSINLTVIQPLIQKALNYMDTASLWSRKAAKKAHMVGLQGEKRRLRYLSRKARYFVDWLEHNAWDVFRIDICAQAGTIDISSLVCPMSTMNGIIEKLWTIYNETHQIANDFVGAKLKHVADCLYKYVDELYCVIGELQRTQIEYEMADYEYHHISRYQVGWCNVHDKYECLEEEQGFVDHR